MVVLVDRATHSAKAVVAVGQNIGHRELFHARSTGRLDNAHIGNVMAGQAVKTHLQVIHITALVMCLQNAIGNGTLGSFCLADGMACLKGSFIRVGHQISSVEKIHTGIIQFQHTDFLPLFTALSGLFVKPSICQERCSQQISTPSRGQIVPDILPV